MNDETKNVIKDIICEHLGICGEEWDPNLSFFDDYNVGPKELLDLVKMIENRFDIYLNRTEVKKIITIRDLVDLTKDALGEIV